jgi:cytochrome c peroxidase
MNRRLAFLLPAILALGVACEQPFTLPDPAPPPPPLTLDAELRQSLQRWFVIPIGPMPQQPPALVALGQALLFDKELSGNRDVSCATCHEPALTVGDGQSLSIGTGGTGAAPSRLLGKADQFVPRNSPTLVNVGLGGQYIFWDGRVSRAGFVGPVGPPFPAPGQRFDTPAGAQLPQDIDELLAAQAMFPVANRTEMRGQAGDLDRFGNPNELAAFADTNFTEIWRAVMRRLLAIPQYVTMFQAAFPGVSQSNLGFQHAAKAIAAFEKHAFTRTNSRFDRYLARDDAALTTAEKRGAVLFFGRAGCGGCHNGALLGGSSFANVGAPQLGPGTGRGAPLDLGFGDRIEQPFYQFAFRVAPLRNVELTAPYMHNGAYATLDAVVHHYSDVPFAQRNYDVSQLAPELRATHHGDEATITRILSNLDFRVQRQQRFSEPEMQDLVAFLKSLTDPLARDLSGIVPLSVPSGLPVRD